MVAPISHDNLLNLLIAVGLFCAVVLAFALIGRRRPSLKEFAIAALVVAALVFVLFFRLFAVLGLPRGHLQFNWWGKVLAIAACLAFVVLDRRTRPADVGLRRAEAGSLVPGLIGMAATSVAMWGVAYAMSSHRLQGWQTEKFFYEATMPGLHEELFHRAIITLLIERVLGPGGGLRVFGVQLSLAALASVAWFGLLHGVGVQDGAFGVSWPTVATACLAGFGLQWIYTRTRSLVLPIITHNAINLGLDLIA